MMNGTGLHPMIKDPSQCKLRRFLFEYLGKEKADHMRAAPGPACT
jgi:hypothetical protein